jgi:hypothetical protein
MASATLLQLSPGPGCAASPRVAVLHTSSDSLCQCHFQSLLSIAEGEVDERYWAFCRPVGGVDVRYRCPCSSTVALRTAPADGEVDALLCTLP